MPSEPTSAAQQSAARARSSSDSEAILPGCIAAFATLLVTLVIDAESGGASRIPVFFAALVLAIIVHELGHLIAGWFVGFRFLAITVLGVQLYRKDNKLGLRWQWERKRWGSARMFASRVVRLRRRQLIFSAGGLAANALSLPIAFAVGQYLAFPAFSFVIASFCLIASNAIPAQSSGDGYKIDVLLFDRKKARRFLAITALHSENQRRVHPKNWKRTWLRAACSIPDGSVDDWVGNQLGYIAANAKNDTNAARIHLDACLRISQLHNRLVK